MKPQHGAGEPGRPLSLEFVVPGPPQPKERARPGLKGFYTPKKTSAYEKAVWTAYLWAAARTLLPCMRDYTGCVRLDVMAFFQWPKSTPLYKRALGWLWRPKTPDWDNVGKIISDALNKIAYKDDGQIVDGRVRKRECDTPHAMIRLEWLGPACEASEAE